MSDRVDLRAVYELLGRAAEACNELEAVLEADRSPRPRPEEHRRGELAMDLWRLRNLAARVRAGIKHLATETTTATSRDVAVETTEDQR